MNLLLLALLSVNAQADVTGTYMNASCVDEQVYEYGKRKKEVKVRVKSAQDTATWIQDGETFEIIYAKEAYSKAFQGRIAVALSRFTTQSDAEGRPAKQAGSFGSLNAHSGGTVNERTEHTFETNWAYEGDIAKTTQRLIDGELSHNMEKQTKVTSPSERTVVRTISQYVAEKSGDYQIVSGVQTCKQVDISREAAMKGKFRGPLRRAVQKFETSLTGVSSAEAALAECRAGGQDCSAQEQALQKSQASRDELWGKLIRPKDLLGYIVSKPRPSPPDYGGGGGGGGWDGGGGSSPPDNRNSCSGSVWCSGFEHCVGGKCVPKDAFNRCDAFNSCQFGESCNDGVCSR